LSTSSGNRSAEISLLDAKEYVPAQRRLLLVLGASGLGIILLLIIIACIMGRRSKLKRGAPLKKMSQKGVRWSAEIASRSSGSVETGPVSIASKSSGSAEKAPVVPKASKSSGSAEKAPVLRDLKNSGSVEKASALKGSREKS
ncbi:hypothetical protein COOONC_15931, partial [Cooperia oncophora]